MRLNSSGIFSLEILHLYQDSLTIVHSSIDAPTYCSSVTPGHSARAAATAYSASTSAGVRESRAPSEPAA
jgi:hypothetical protein